MVIALGLDLGTTRIKLLAMDESGCIDGLWSSPAPEMKRRGRERTTDSLEYLESAETLISEAGVPKNVPLGISCQRSSFLFWDKGTGKPLSPLISWQDTRASDWCHLQARFSPMVWKKTGLPLAPNYAAPKMKVVLEEDRALHSAAVSGSVLWGTLDSFLIWNWTGGKTGGKHRIDVSLAARTLLVDAGKGKWDWSLAEFFGIPVDILPKIDDSCGFRLASHLGHPITASVADQTCGAFPVFAAHPNAVMINAGTGTFVLRPSSGRAPDGILTALVGSIPGLASKYLWEGPINAGARVLNAHKEHGDFESDSSLEGFAIPDEGILAAPFWRPLTEGFYTGVQAEIEPAVLARLKFEGLLFRIRQVVDAMVEERPEICFLSGGLAAHVFFRQALACLIQAPLHLLDARELGALGAAWLAAGATFPLPVSSSAIQMDRSWEYLVSRYERWKSWLDAFVSK